MMDISEAAEQGRRKLRTSLENAKQEFVASTEEIKENSSMLDCRKQEIDVERRVVERIVDLCIQRLEEHKRAMLRKLKVINEEQQKTHDSKQRELQVFVTQLKTTMQYGKGVLERNIDDEIAQEWEAVSFRCEDLIDSAGNREPLQLPTVRYCVDEELFEKVKEAGPGQITVSKNKSFMPEIHQYRRLCSLRSQCYGQGQFMSPRGVAISPGTGNIIVCDSRKILVFNAQRQYMWSFGNTRDDTKNLSRPTSVAYLASDEIIVNDSGVIVVCSSQGAFRNYALNVHAESTVSIFSQKIFCRDLIVCDKGDSTVKVLTFPGILKASFSIPGVQPSFAIHHEDKFFVSCKEKQCVKVFNDDGAFLFDIGAKGLDEEKLRGPLGLVIDSFNNLVVCDKDKGRLQIFKLDGSHVAMVEGEATKLASPEFIAVSKEGHLFVTDPRRNCVHVFQ